MWNVMIRGYSSSNRTEEALVLYNQMVSCSVPPNAYSFPFLLRACMKLAPPMGTMPVHSSILKTEMNESGIKPNAVTLTAVLSACSRAGLVEEGKSIFMSIDAVHSLKPSMEHYGSLVDLLGEVGLLDNTWKVVETMPFEPNAEVLCALLKACRIHGGRYIHAASISAAAGDWEEVVRIRMKMKGEGVIKDRGCSRLTVNGIVHEIFARDQSHPRIEEINEMWNQVVMKIRKQLYRLVLRDLLLDLDDDEKKAPIERHSEKVALCFGLISTEPAMTIQIFKDLHFYEDCHTATKMISNEIVMRDRIHFHEWSLQLQGILVKNV